MVQNGQKLMATLSFIRAVPSLRKKGRNPWARAHDDPRMGSHPKTTSTTAEDTFRARAPELGPFKTPLLCVEATQ